MRKVLYILGQLDDTDVDWMAKSGKRQVVAPNSVVIHQGVRQDNVYIVLDGALDVSIAGVGSVANLLSGEIIGEMSFVDSAPPSATVSARTQAELLAIPKDVLEDKIASEPLFGLRFYKSIALFLADRLRNAQKPRQAGGTRANASATEVEADELDEMVLDSISLAGDRFDRLVKTVRG